MTVRSPLATALALALLFVPCSARSAPTERDEELIEAVQQNRTERAIELIDQGVDVNSKTRYGATPIFFAVDKGNLELVRELLERGANVNVTDTFYSATPLTWALFSVDKSADHRAIVLELLAAGANEAGAVLGSAADSGDLELARAAIESGRASAAELRSATAAAAEAGHEELARYVAENTPPEEPVETLEIPLEVLGRYVGTYQNEEFSVTSEVALEEGALKVRREGIPETALIPTGENRFAVQGMDDLEYAFTGRGGLIEGFTITRDGNSFAFTRIDPDGDRAELETPRAAPLPKIDRRPAAPWPSFRGPALSGIADGQGAPTHWNGEAGDNVLWRAPIPGIALSSPIVWGDRVFVTTSLSSSGDSTFRTGLYGDVDSVEDDSAHTWNVYALDRASGEIVWQRTAATGAPKKRRHTKSSHANPTPVTDGRHLIAHFGSEGLFCYDFDGKLLWHQELGILSSGWFYDATYEWGFSSSPILHNGLVIVQTDVQKESFIAAFDVETGEQRWRTARDEIPTWGTPNVVSRPDGSAEVVTNGTTVRGYDAMTGKELWTLGPNSEITVGSPVVSGDVVYVTGGYPPVRPIYAIRPGGRGDISPAEGSGKSDHLLWSETRGGTYIPTPLVYQEHLYMFHNDGRLTVHDAASGELIYRQRIGRAESFSSSPVAADGRLYFTSEEGKTYVVRSGPVYELLAENELGEVVMASPAISDGMMILRGMHHLFALGERSATTASSR